MYVYSSGRGMYLEVEIDVGRAGNKVLFVNGEGERCYLVLTTCIPRHSPYKITCALKEHTIILINDPLRYPVSHFPHFFLFPLFPTDVEPSPAMHIGIHINIYVV